MGLMDIVAAHHKDPKDSQQPAESSRPANAGFLFGHKWEGQPVNWAWSWDPPNPYPIPSHY